MEIICDLLQKENDENLVVTPKIEIKRDQCALRQPLGEIT